MKRIFSLLLVLVMLCVAPINVSAGTKTVQATMSWRKAPKVTKGTYIVKFKHRDDGFVKYTAKKTGWHDFTVRDLRQGSKSTNKCSLLGHCIIRVLNKDKTDMSYINIYEDYMKVTSGSIGFNGDSRINLKSGGSSVTGDYSRAVNFSVKMKKGTTVYFEFGATADNGKVTFKIHQ